MKEKTANKDLLSDFFLIFPEERRAAGFSDFADDPAQKIGLGNTGGLRLGEDGALHEYFGSPPTEDRQSLTDAQIAQTFRLRFCERLTITETHLLRGLVAGMTVKALSERDAVSYETRRNQLKMIMSKSGVPRQSDLVSRMTSLLVLSVTKDREADIRAQSRIKRFLDQFYRAPLRLYSPRFSDARALLVLDIGPTNGRPVIHMHSAFLSLFPLPETARRLEDLNLRIITPFRPGYFGTPVDWSLDFDARLETHTATVAEFLSDFDLSSSPIFSHAHGVMAAISLARRLGNQSPRLVLHSAQYAAGAELERQPSWAKATFKLVMQSPRLGIKSLELLAGAITRPRNLDETLNKGYGASQADLDCLLRPERAAWRHSLFAQVGRDNIPGIISDYEGMTSDWPAVLDTLSVPTELVYGSEDQYGNFTAIQRHEQRPNREVTIIENEGMLSMLDQPDLIAAQLFPADP